MSTHPDADKPSAEKASSKKIGPGVSPRTKAIASLGVVAASLLTVTLNIAAARHYRRWDATRSRIYSLSEPTTFTLRDIETRNLDVEMFVFIGSGDPLLGSIKQMLQGYQALAPRRLIVRFLDPDRNPAEFQRLQLELDVHANKAEGGRLLSDAQIVVRRGARVWYVKTDDLVVLDEGDDAKVKPRVELALTSAIRSVLLTDRPRICFTVGHHESPADDPAKEGLTQLRNTLAKDNFAPEPVDLSKPGVSLLGCALIAVMAPQDPFKAGEAKPIVDAVKQGAGLLLVAPPEIDVEKKTLRPHGLDEVAALAGVALDDSVTVELDERLREPSGLGLIFRARVASHPTTDDLRRFAESRGAEAAVPVAYVRSLRRLDTPGAVSPSPLLVSSDRSFGLTDVNGFLGSREEPKKAAGDRQGPLDLGVAASREKSIGGSRVVVLGTITPYLNAAYADNSPPMQIARTLGLLFLSWLTARPPILDLPPKPSVQVALHLTEDDIGSIGRYVLLYMPSAIGLLGLAVYLRRRSTEGKRAR